MFGQREPDPVSTSIRVQGGPIVQVVDGTDKIFYKNNACSKKNRREQSGGYQRSYMDDIFAQGVRIGKKALKTMVKVADQKVLCVCVIPKEITQLCLLQYSIVSGIFWNNRNPVFTEQVGSKSRVLPFWTRDDGDRRLRGTEYPTQRVQIVRDRTMKVGSRA